jgi:hypothetical protein
MPDILKRMYRSFYNWWKPIPSDAEIAEIVKSVLGGQGSAEISSASQQVCLVSFSNGDHDICIPSIHQLTACEMAAARINQKSGRTDAVGNLLDGPCPVSSKTIQPAS